MVLLMHAHDRDCQRPNRRGAGLSQVEEGVARSAFTEDHTTKDADPPGTPCLIAGDPAITE